MKSVRALYDTIVDDTVDKSVSDSTHSIPVKPTLVAHFHNRYSSWKIKLDFVIHSFFAAA